MAGSVSGIAKVPASCSTCTDLCSTTPIRTPTAKCETPNKDLSNPAFKTDDSAEFWKNWFEFVVTVSPLGPEEALEQLGANLRTAFIP
jgi:hypothetical protein